MEVQHVCLTYTCLTVATLYQDCKFFIHALEKTHSISKLMFLLFFHSDSMLEYMHQASTYI